MYIHIGADVSIPAHWIVGIFDLDRVTSASDTVAFLKRAEDENMLDWMTPDVPRSLIVTVDRIFLSPVSTATLRSRLRGKRANLKGHYE
ncbi:MAG: DUF370 domain-containing protein [Clostridiaceae bacterium]|jgi:hypothetical protein|nr:DUF370 domain-containing protein [Clostridiaceae bacterium]